MHTHAKIHSDLTGVVDLRYTGGARMLMMLEIGAGRWRFKVGILVLARVLEPSGFTFWVG